MEYEYNAFKYKIVLFQYDINFFVPNEFDGWKIRQCASAWHPILTSFLSYILLLVHFLPKIDIISFFMYSIQ